MNTFSIHFAACTTLDEIRSTFRKLALLWHPDRRGDDTTAQMQAINAAYQAALKSIDGATFKRHDNDKEYTYRYNAEQEGEVAEKFEAACGLNLPDIEILLIGTWVWITGNTKPHKDAIKGIGFRFHSKRTAWVWHPKTAHKSRFNPRLSLDDLKDKHGGTAVRTSGRPRLAVIN